MSVLKTPARVLAKNARCRAKNGAKWAAAAKARYEASPLMQTKRVWKLIQRRCYDPKCDKYKYYGGRGITVCQRWRDSFDAFVEDVGLRPAGLTIDRIDNDGNYEPGNVKWSTHSEQMRNRRTPKNLIPTYLCGTCPRCLNRAAVKRYRERKQVA